ncbi:MAG: type I secretion system permease/ATPase [Clostridium sp.]|nr:type I secretion system permease/ATPase [Clostridium sp.]MCM1170837.1 type I secretion system permease/ATPase [Clostridium sp.]MCM1208432.1 type I secretion system permease/ATPase [Ruminococcus sp.]
MDKNPNTGYMCFLIVTKFLGVKVPKDYEKRFLEKENTFFALVRTAKDLDLKAAAGKLKVKKLDKTTVPVIARLKKGGYLLLVNHQNDKWVILNPLKGTPENIDEKKLFEELSGEVIILGKGKTHTGENGNKKFGFGWFIPTIMKFKKQFICVLIAVFFIQILGILTPLMTQVVVDKVLAHHAMNTLNTIAIGIFIVYIYELLISLCKSYLFVHTTNRIDVMLSAKLFHHLFGLPLKYFESRRVGETVARVRELDQIRAFLTGTPLSSIVDVFFVSVYIVVLFLYNVRLALIITASLPVFAILSIIVTPLFKKRLDEKFETGARSQSFLVEAINGIHTVKAFALENSFEDKWGDLQSDYVKAGYKTSMISQTSGAVANFVQHVVDLLVLVFGAKAVIAGSLSIGQLVAFRMLAGRVSGPVLRLVQLWQEYQQASLSVKRIGDIFNSPVESMSDNTLQEVPSLGGKIRFENVRFRYKMDAADVLHGISLEIKENSITGLVGRSGSGKSTISKLIQRLYIPQSGRISIDGMDVSLMPPQTLRRQIGVVLQENFMFNGTVAENISIHCPEASVEKIIETAKLAGAHDFIMELEQGYDTVIGEQGVSLSGGQKQRVAIARAIINNPRILIFDEATSALDYESESIIQRNLKDICKNRTVLIIAHRLSTLSAADEIMVIDRGELKERGNHEILMRRNGLYAYLYRQQLRGDTE